MLQRSRYTVAYTGAGISTGAGLADYATKARKLENTVDPLEARPTRAHRVLAQLSPAGDGSAGAGLWKGALSA